jgi:hypothetical protein
MMHGNAEVLISCAEIIAFHASNGPRRLEAYAADVSICSKVICGPAGQFAPIVLTGTDYMSLAGARGKLCNRI